MGLNWTEWCRLCGSEEDSQINFFKKDKNFTDDIVNKINVYLSIMINETDEYPKSICNECFNFLESIDQFSKRCSRIQEMFQKLVECVGENVKTVRNEYGLGMEEIALKEELDSTMESYEVVEDFLEISKADSDATESSDFTPQLEIEILQPDSEDHKNFIKSPKSKKKDPKIFKNSCTECNKVFAREHYYRLHMKNVHEIQVTAPNYACSYCDKVLRSPSTLKLHEVKHLPDEKKYVLPCPFCDRKFTKNEAVKLHIKSVHTEERKYVCEECGKAFKLKGNLRDHKSIHSEEYNHSCDICQKKFKTQGRLKMHMEIHSDNYYVCPICGLKLNTRNTFLMHKVVHSDERKFKCNICGMDFKRMKNYKRHLTLHTGLKNASKNS